MGICRVGSIIRVLIWESCRCRQDEMCIRMYNTKAFVRRSQAQRVLFVSIGSNMEAYVIHVCRVHKESLLYRVSLLWLPSVLASSGERSIV